MWIIDVEGQNGENGEQVVVTGAVLAFSGHF